MTFRLRAARALLLLGGFYALGAALLTAMALLDRLLVSAVLTEEAPGGRAFLYGVIVFATLLMTAVIVRGMLVSLRSAPLPPLPHALAVAPEDHPALWAEVRAAAEATGQRPPDELHLVDEVNAGVAEQRRFLGLVPGRRRMVLGLPLVAGLTVPQLRAVLAHEFGHYGNRDTRVGGLTMRGRSAVLHTVEVFERGGSWLHHAIGGLYVGYARFFLRVSQSVAREQELAADLTAARHAGRDATASALRALPVLDAAHDHYLETYAALGGPAGALPPPGEVLGGFRRLLAARPGDRLTALSAGHRPPPPHPHDSHPPIAERAARVEALPADDRSPDTTPALTLLRDADHAFLVLEERTLPAPLTQAPRLSWDELVTARAAADAETWSRPLRVAVARAAATGRIDDDHLPGLEDVLDAFDRGLLWPSVADHMPRPLAAERLTGASARAFLRPRLFDALAGLVHLRLLAAGRATPDIAWSGAPGLLLPPSWEAGMDDAIDAALADAPDTTALRALLAADAHGTRPAGV
ncbi:M48 family metallopeptidase [Streptomyces sp. NPDC060194]|uniref:M48 family metallopeptidase n=1 Tax=Streptomyces sp. NPDC060194 TaxID=3347069 RepID=UPI00365F4C42